MADGAVGVGTNDASDLIACAFVAFSLYFRYKAKV